MKWLILAIVLAACGNPDHHVIALPDGKTADAAAADAPVTRSGLVSLGEEATTSNAGAIFAYGDVFGAHVGVDGPCTVTMSPAQRGLSGGAITITGTTTALTLSPMGAAPNVNYSTSPAAPPTLFAPGAPITVHGAGGPDFPAFDATVNGPATLAGFTKPTAISRSGYTATWTAGTQKIWVIFVATNNTTVPAYVVCRVNDTGTFTIPVSTFAMIPADYNQAAVGVGRVSSTDVATIYGVVTVAAISDITSGFVPLGP